MLSTVTAPPQLRAGPGPGDAGTAAAVIRTDALTKRYAGDVTALAGLTVDIHPGITGLVGANGAGKSTLIKILLGLLPPTSGRAVVLGHDVSASGERIRTLTGYMPEHDCLPPDVTGTEFVTHLGRMSGLPATAAKERAAESLRHVGLYEERYRQVGTYSTGMKQRVKLAQAVVHDPELLFLDEPTNGLDPAGRDEMLELIADLPDRRGLSVILSSHLLPDVEKVCDEVMVLAAGKLQYVGTIAALRGDADARYTVRVKDGIERLAEALRAAGLAADVKGEELTLTLPGGDTDTVFAAAETTGVQIRHLAPLRRSLESAFLSTLKGAA